MSVSSLQPPTRRAEFWRTKRAAFATLVVLNAVYRLPAFLNAAGVNSDAAVVGLQAMHMLRGEVERSLWGVGYQGSFDAMVVAVLFALFGPTPGALMAAPFLGHIVVCACAFDMLARRTRRPWVAALICLPLVFTPQAINGVVLYAPRQWCIASLFVAMWLFEVGARRRPLRFFVGAALAWLATYLDLYGMQIVVPLMGYMLLCAFDATSRARAVLARAGSGALGAALGAWVVRWLRADASLQQADLSFTWEQVQSNWVWLSKTCLPWVLGAKTWVPGPNLYPDPWLPPGVVRVFQGVGAASLVLFIAAAPLLVFVRRIDWPLKRLGLFGAAGAAASVGGFLVSHMPSDMWSARYLAPVVWLAPFALAPWTALLGKRALAVLLAPYLVIAALGGWKSYGPYVDGALPRIAARGSAKQEMKLAELLRAKRVGAAYAQYWLAYRLTFLWRENPIVMPLADDRYPKYRQQTAGAKTVAFIFHPSEPRAVPEQVLPSLTTGTVERLEIEGFTVLLQRR
jgi:hypothetical protein